MWIKHSAVSTDQKRYLYRADGSTHDGERNGLWIACDDEVQLAENKGVIRSVQSDADLPIAAGLEWIQAEGLVVSEVRVGSGSCLTARMTYALLLFPRFAGRGGRGGVGRKGGGGEGEARRRVGERAGQGGCKGRILHARV